MHLFIYFFNKNKINLAKNTNFGKDISCQFGSVTFFILNHVVTIALLVLSYFIFKIFNFERVQAKLKPLQIGSDLKIKEMLDRVLRLPAVGSKRYLTNKVRNLMVSRVLY